MGTGGSSRQKCSQANTGSWPPSVSSVDVNAYCGMAPETRNTGVRWDVHCYTAARKTHFRDNLQQYNYFWETLFYVLDAPASITRIRGQLESELRVDLQMTVDWLKRDDRKEIRLCKEDFIVLQWQWDCYESVARIRQVKTENTCVYVIVNYKVFKLLVVPSECIMFQ
jgi:hypothetical protein